MAKLLYQGHGSLRAVTDAGIVLYVDPFAGDGYDLPADLILVTHQHGDHNQLQLPAKKSDCIVWQNSDALVGGVYKTETICGLRVEAVQAYNKNHKRDECVGFLVELDGRLVYFAGDTSRTEQMKTFAARSIDYALLPCDGVYNMDLEEASACAELIAARHSIPIHMAPGRLFDRARAERFTGPGRLILEPGQEIEL